MVAAGTLNRQVTLLRRTQSGTTPLNEPVFFWAPVLKFWAAMIHRKEDEAFAASQRYATRAVTFRAHMLPEQIQEFDELECEGVRYDIKGVREIGFRAGIEINCEAKL